MTKDDDQKNYNNQRVSMRLISEEPAVLVQKKNKIPVEVFDMGLEGFGLKSAVDVESENEIEVEVSGDDGLDIYRCTVVFCRKEGDYYRLGLKIIDHMPDVVYLEPDEIATPLVHKFE